MHKFNRLFSKVLIGASIVIGGICLLGFGSPATGVKVASMVGVACAGFGLLVGGVLLMSSKSAVETSLTTEREKILLKIIRDHGGKVTPAEIAAKSHLSIAESQEGLDALCAAGAGDMEILKGGKLLYVFHGILTDEEKSTSQDVMNMDRDDPLREFKQELSDEYLPDHLREDDV